jgi:hypothetical protein
MNSEWWHVDKLFTLRVRLSRGYATIHVFDGGKYDTEPRLGVGADRIDVVVRHEGKTIFPRGATWCGTPRCGGMTLDGNEAKELVLSLVAMKPGDTDDDYFASYTPEQLSWCQEFGEELSAEREWRYCDENGNVKRRRT